MKQVRTRSFVYIYILVFTSARESMPMIHPRPIQSYYVGTGFRHRCLSVGPVCLNSTMYSPLSQGNQIAPRIRANQPMSTILRVLGPMTSYNGSVRPPQSRLCRPTNRPIDQPRPCLIGLSLHCLDLWPFCAANGRLCRIRPANFNSTAAMYCRRCCDLFQKTFQ